MKKFTFIFKLFEWIIFFGLVFLIVLLLSPILPIKQYFSSYAIVSGSMEPAIKTGALVVTNSNVSSLSPGDVIAFESPENSKDTIVHRILTIDSNGIYTKGDNNNVSDNWVVSYNNVKGKILFSIPYVGQISSSVRTPLGFFIVIGIPSLIIAALQVKKIYEGIEEEIKKRTQLEVSKQTEATSAVNSII